MHILRIAAVAAATALATSAFAQNATTAPQAGSARVDNDAHGQDLGQSNRLLPQAARDGGGGEGQVGAGRGGARTSGSASEGGSSADAGARSGGGTTTNSTGGRSGGGASNMGN